MGNCWLLSQELLRMVVVFARRVRYDQQISYCLELYLLQPACLLKPASNKEPVAKSCKGTECLAQMGLVNAKFMKNEGEMCFFIHNVRLCHFVTLWVTSFFSHLPRKSYFSSLTFLVSLSCQLIFLSPHTQLALHLASSYLLMLHYFSHSFVDFSYIFAEQTSEIQALQNFISFMLCSPPLTLQSFFLFVAFPAACAPLFVSVVHSWR